MKKLLAFHGDKKLKAAMLREITKHEKADAILQGTYGKQNGHWKGCAVACSLRSLDIIEKKELRESYDQHARYESELGISQTIARLEDRLFEGMKAKDAKTFPRRFIEAIPVGADLSLVPARFMVFILNDTLNNFDNDKNPDVVKAVQGSVAVWEGVINGTLKGKKLESAARSAWSAAESARSAAWSALSAWSARSAWSAAASAWSAAWSALSAWSAAESAAESARSAAWSAWSAAWSARSAAAYKRFADYLLKLLQDAPNPDTTK